MRTLLLLALLLAPLAYAQTAPATMSGEWFVQESAGGSDSVKICEFTQKSSDLSGTCTAKAMGSMAITGKVDGDKITWTMKFQTMVGPVTATYHGTRKAENKITGIVNAQEFKMEGGFSATRYKLVWSDEFNQDGKPDPKKWAFETGFVRNRELQWYQPDNARCADGLLIIEARRERIKNPNYGRVKPVFQVLMYPTIDDRTTLKSETNGRGKLIWTPELNLFGWKSYLGQTPYLEDDRPYAAAARRKDLSGLPPAWIGVGDLDLFYDEDVEYCRGLQVAGGSCKLDVVLNAYHGFNLLAKKAPGSTAFNERMIDALRVGLEATPQP